MSCVRAAPTAAPAMRPDMQNTVMAVGNTSVGENMLGQDSRAYAQLGHGPTHLSLPPPHKAPPSPPPSFPLVLEMGLRARASTMPNRFSITDLSSPVYVMLSKFQRHISLPLHT